MYLLNYSKTFTVLRSVTSQATIGTDKAALVQWRGRINDLLWVKYIAQAFEPYTIAKENSSAQTSLSKILLQSRLFFHKEVIKTSLHHRLSHNGRRAADRAGTSSL